ncbi:MAG TPA: GNAT family N-acetyltransferase [Gemmatimonadota bacterium]
MIRELRDTDLQPLAAMVRELVPTMVVSQHTIDHMRKSATWWVTERDGELIGAARAGRFGRGWVGVVEGARRQGLGTRLLEIMEDAVRQAGHPEAVGWTDGGAGARFAEARGYQAARMKPVSVLRLDKVEASPIVVPDGVRLIPLVELDERLHELYHLAMVAYGDLPDGGRDAEQSFEEWLRDDLGIPELDFHGSLVAEIDGRLAALSFMTTDGLDRAENDFTGTHPDFRGRGLATLVKRATIEWARGRGIREIWTGNDGENAPMLAINRKLGYREEHVRVMHVKRFP